MKGTMKFLALCSLALIIAMLFVNEVENILKLGFLATILMVMSFVVAIEMDIKTNSDRIIMAIQGKIVETDDLA